MNELTIERLLYFPLSRREQVILPSAATTGVASVLRVLTMRSSPTPIRASLNTASHYQFSALDDALKGCATASGKRLYSSLAHYQLGPKSRAI